MDTYTVGDRRALSCELEHGAPVAVVGQQKGRDAKQRRHRNCGMTKPEGYRKALRVRQLAVFDSLRPIGQVLRRHAAELVHRAREHLRAGLS